MTLVDTNLITCYLRPRAEIDHPREHEFVDGLIESGSLAISHVTQFELQHGQAFATSEARLVENLRRIGFPTSTQVIDVSSAND